MSRVPGLEEVLTARRHSDRSRRPWRWRSLQQPCRRQRSTCKRALQHALRPCTPALRRPWSSPICCLPPAKRPPHRRKLPWQMKPPVDIACKLSVSRPSSHSAGRQAGGWVLSGRVESVTLTRPHRRSGQPREQQPSARKARLVFFLLLFASAPYFCCGCGRLRWRKTRRSSAWTPAPSFRETKSRRARRVVPGLTH